ncbi:DUF1501 domain-containing protein [Gemmata sp. JC673]|uniref:DUF1501 domain-containing protein n=1 Tax=Gemmata algarum TaxID=2975278 RepID=A0ABU5F3W9_9BACT|nr:DUF1501 domain-containing protein [Gemmata algarum]MDY3561889.1 DUF1501 domain-containing protein [Gemmata algarum]
MITRRSLLKSALLPLAPTVPLFIARSVRAAAPEKDARVLVVVEMDGGNDALNTVVPHADEAYIRLRPKLNVNPANVVKLTDGVGLHPALRPLDKLLQAGHLAVVPGVGYPNPSRSHFDSMATWHTAGLDAEARKGYGWLGRALDPSGGHLFAVGGEVPPALRGRRSSAVAFKRLEEVLLADPGAAKAGAGQTGGNDLFEFVRRQSVEAHGAAEKLASLAGSRGGATYPQTELAERLKLVAQLLKADIGARVFYAQQSGYDTHAQQQFTHSGLLGEFAGAVAAFFADLAEAKLADRVTLLSFSEFGRTIRENGSAGTDHGTVGACFVAGPSVRGGLVGAMPSLTELDAGEPKATTDFRGVYRAVLTDFMGVPADGALKAGAEVKLFR